MNPWQLYDDLIDAVPADVRVRDAQISRFAQVTNDAGGCGLALADRSGSREPRGPELVVDRSLRDVAALAKSWDFQLAGLGVAALNSWFNTAERVVAAGAQSEDRDCFEMRADRVGGKRVGVIGHFAGLDRLWAASELVVLERGPRAGDLPDPACEYELPSCDEVYITGTTLANKTLPRLLELSRDAHTVLVGPSVTFAPEVYGDLVDEIAGSWVAQPAEATQLVRLGGSMRSVKHVFTRFNWIGARSDDSGNQ